MTGFDLNLTESFLNMTELRIMKGHPPSADLRYREEVSSSPSTLIFAAIKG